MTDKPGEFDKHEALHMAMVFGDVFENHVLDTKFVRSDPGLLARAEVISDLIGELYQAIGIPEEKTG